MKNISYFTKILINLFFLFFVSISTIFASELIANGNFESGSASWVKSGNFYINAMPHPHYGSYYAYLSKSDGNPGDNLLGNIYQQITIPSNASSVILTYYYSITSDETENTAYDILDATLQNSSGQYLATLDIYSNLDKRTDFQYQIASFDITAFKGQTIRINFLGTTDPSLPTAFRIDDVSVSATIPETPPASPTNLIACGIENEISVVWNDNSNNETGFILERKTGSSGTYSNLATINADINYFYDTNISFGTIYYYRVYAYNSGGASQSYSNEDSAIALSSPSITSPSDGTTLETNSVNLQWSSVNGAGNYLITMGTSPGDTSILNDYAVNNNSYTINSLNNGTYYWNVRANNDTYGGVSSPSSSKHFIVIIPSQTDRHALLVGIDHYSQSYGAGDLPSCVNDANGVRDIMMLGDTLNRWPSGNLQSLTDGQATKSAIRSELQSLASQSVAGDIVVYFQSSHGGQYSGTNTYLCTYNADYSDTELGADLALFSSSVKVIVIVDACHSGGLFKDVGWPFAEKAMEECQRIKIQDFVSKGLSVPKDLGSNIAFMTACDYDETCWAGTTYSLYTEYLLEACTIAGSDTNLDGESQFLEIHNYADSHSQSDNPDQNAQSLNDTLLGSIAARTNSPIPPPAPTEVSASDGTYTDKVRITWNASSGATAYGIIRNITNNLSSGTVLNIVNTLSYDDTSAVAGTTYYYWIAASSDATNWSFSSTDTGYRANPPTTYMLMVNSSGANGVSIQVSPSDNNSQGTGTTSFSRTYNTNTYVTLTAPSTSGGMNFSSWSGADSSNGATAYVTMSGNKTVTANYVTPPPQTYTLTIQSSGASAVSIQVSPSDNNSQGVGTTSFTRTYNVNTYVTLTAPSTSGGMIFSSWSGADSSNGTTAYVTMSGGKTVTANYQTPPPPTPTATTVATPTETGIATPTETAIATPTPTTIVTIFQPGSEGKDTYYGTTYMQNGGTNSETLSYGGWSDYYYDYLEFDLSMLPSDTQTTKAELYLYVTTNAPNDPGLQIYRITQSWTEAGVTSSNKPTSVLYKNFGTVLTGWNIVDITDLYKDWKSGEYSNYGVKLNPTSNNNTNGAFASSDNTNASIRPKLVVTFTSTSFSVDDWMLY